MVPEGHFHMRPFQWHLREHCRFPQSLDILLPSSEIISVHLELWQKPVNVTRGSVPHPKDHSIKIFTTAAKIGWGAHLNQNSTKHSRTEGSISRPEDFQGPVSKSNSVDSYRRLNSGSLNKQQAGNPPCRVVCSPVEIHDLVPSVPNNPMSQHIPGCLNVMADSLSRSHQIQSTEWSLHPQVFKHICQKWFTPLATSLNHKFPLYVSPVSDQHALEIDALNIDLSGFIAYAYPPTALLYKMI